MNTIGRSWSLEEPIQRKNFVRQNQRKVEAPDLLNIQLESWQSFLQSDMPQARRKNRGLQAVFKMNFPITDARENFLLEFIEYYVEKPKYSVPECEERGLTYAVPLKAKLRLSQKAEDGKKYFVLKEESLLAIIN